MSGKNNIEKLDLTKILKNCPKGWKFYSKIHGDVNFYGFNLSDNYPIIVSTFDNFLHRFTKNGKKFYLYKGECILVPSREQQDWSKFEAPWYKKKKNDIERFDPNTLNPFDKVLVKDDDTCNWRADFYSNKGKSKKFPYMCVGATCKYCIPYNNNTKHLVGTTDEAPEYYRYWEMNCKQK